MKTPCHFGPYHLDPASAQLFKGSNALPLPPKALTLLVYLVERRGRLIGKDELLDAVWGTRFVSEGVLKNTMQTLRQALDDDPKAPRYIETAHRRGYRFIAEVKTETAPPAVGTAPAAALASENPTPALVGRAPDLAHLRGLLDQALRGEPQVVFVTGEPGIGKTALIDAFLRQVDAAGVARGQCVEQYGPSEPYLPMLEALNTLGRHNEPRLAGLLQQVAPTWLAQLPWLLNPDDRTRLHQELQGATQARMLRELGELLERWTQDQPVILVLEDLHWSDHATLDLLAYLARRKRPARWLILGSYRPVEVIVTEHPLKTVKRDLHIQGLCRELPLELLTEAAVGKYLAQRHPDWHMPTTWVQAIHARTEGLPFFLVQLAENLRESRTASGDTLDGALPSTLPEGLQQLIEQQFERLSPAEQRMLEAASVASANFSAAAVAAALEAAPPEVEDGCERLARLRHFLRPAALADWETTGRYGFLHAFYHEFAYGRLPPAKRAELHRRVGQWLETACAGRSEEQAAELALHFERGRDYPRAVQYLQQAAGYATRRHALHEAASLLRRGVTLLEERLPETPEHIRCAADLYAALCMALQATQGYASPELERVYARALALAQRVGETARLLRVLYGLWAFDLMRSDLASGLTHAEQLHAIAERAGDVPALIAAHFALSGIFQHRGELHRARQHIEASLALYDPEAHGQLYLVYAQDPSVVSRFGQGRILWLQGFPDQAMQTALAGVARAQTLAHPFTQGMALVNAAWVAVDRREYAQTSAYCAQINSLSSEQGFPHWQAMAAIKHGWALAFQGQAEAGIAEIRQGLANYNATGARMSLPFYLGLLAQAQAQAGQFQAGLETLAEALTQTERLGEYRHAAEIRRLHGELLLKAELGMPEEAEDYFQQALALARRQAAKSLELRAATSLARLWRTQGRAAEARELLSNVYGWFTEGFDTPDLQEAKALLDSMTQDSPAR